MLDLPVPRTTVIARGVAPFRFGRTTETGETWIRTCPVEQVPGRFTTQRGWRDPFRLMAEEDPEGTKLSSVLAQEGVEAAYSGALVASVADELTIVQREVQLGLSAGESLRHLAERADLEEIGSLASVPQTVRGAARESIGTSLQVARGLGPAQSAALRSAAHHAFLSSMRVTFAVGTAIVVLALTVAYRYLPARALAQVDFDGEPATPEDEARHQPLVISVENASA